MQEQTNQEMRESENQKIQCRECGEMKKRIEFRNVKKPEMCLACMKKRRMANREQERKNTNVGNGKKEKLSLEVSLFCRTVIDVLAVRKNKAEVLEEWALRAFQEASEIQRLYITSLLKEKTPEE
jgi:hypothetical protein